ncbi:uncharacterized protein LOC110854709 [Folsomia candida]|uniref:uncharacterized protein LOC110854709 n=1 Tax=Folsomia candida TaxID=158441 RepID=UPI001604BD84|nr:uncharacterized protein LOC110854709 [Folsomia candida]
MSETINCAKFPDTLPAQCNCALPSSSYKNQKYRHKFEIQNYKYLNKNGKKIKNWTTNFNHDQDEFDFFEFCTARQGRDHYVDRLAESDDSQRYFRPSRPPRREDGSIRMPRLERRWCDSLRKKVIPRRHPVFLLPHRRFTPHLPRPPKTDAEHRHLEQIRCVHPFKQENCRHLQSFHYFVRIHSPHCIFFRGRRNSSPLLSKG